MLQQLLLALLMMIIVMNERSNADELPACQPVCNSSASFPFAPTACVELQQSEIGLEVDYCSDVHFIGTDGGIPVDGFPLTSM